MNEILTLISIVTTIVVGVILRSRIKSQNTIIGHYINLLNAHNPDNIIKLHNREVEKIKETMSMDIDELRTQVLELGTATNNVINVFEAHKYEGMDNPFKREVFISTNLPHCRKILDEINESRN